MRIRIELMPLLESLSPRIVEHLNALADELSELPPPKVVDERGDAVPLGRAHLVAIRRLVERRSRSGHVLLPGGRSVRFDRELGRPVLDGQPPDAPSRPKSRRSRVKPSGGQMK